MINYNAEAVLGMFFIGVSLLASALPAGSDAHFYVSGIVAASVSLLLQGGLDSDSALCLSTLPFQKKVEGTCLPVFRLG